MRHQSEKHLPGQPKNYQNYRAIAKFRHIPVQTGFKIINIGIK